MEILTWKCFVEEKHNFYQNSVLFYFFDVMITAVCITYIWWECFRYWLIWLMLFFFNSRIYFALRCVLLFTINQNVEGSKVKERLHLKTEKVKAATIQQLQHLQWQLGVGTSDFNATWTNSVIRKMLISHFMGWSTSYISSLKMCRYLCWLDVLYHKVDTAAPYKLHS